MNTFVRLHHDAREKHSNFKENTVLDFFFFLEERSPHPHSILTLVMILFSLYWSSFLGSLTDVSNFNYLVLKMFFEEKFIFCVVENCSYLGTAAACLRWAGVSRYTARLELKVEDDRAESSCRQTFTCSCCCCSAPIHLDFFSLF